MAALSHSCDMWDLVPWPGFEPKALALGAQGLSHWITMEVPLIIFVEYTWHSVYCALATLLGNV